MSHPRDYLRRRMDLDASVEAALVWTLMRPVEPGSDVPFQAHVCRALTADGCSLAYTERPEMCRTFPYGFDKPCQSCGACSDAEARGVAMQVSAAWR